MCSIYSSRYSSGIQGRYPYLDVCQNLLSSMLVGSSHPLTSYFDVHKGYVSFWPKAISETWAAKRKLTHRPWPWSEPGGTRYIPAPIQPTQSPAWGPGPWKPQQARKISVRNHVRWTWTYTYIYIYITWFEHIIWIYEPCFQNVIFSFTIFFEQNPISIEDYRRTQHRDMWCIENVESLSCLPSSNQT